MDLWIKLSGSGWAAFPKFDWGRDRDGGGYVVPVERDSVGSRHNSVVGFQCHRNYHEQMDLSGLSVSSVISFSAAPPLFSNVYVGHVCNSV